MSEERIEVGTLVDSGETMTLPVVDVLTGRGFATGKSGAGKSNTVSVVVEQLLEAGYPVCIIDTDGEYYGLKESYELLHAGADAECDIQVGAEHAEKIATLALEENVPIILDVSGYLDESEAEALIRETARHLFAKEKKLKKPFLLVVEEVHEYIPEGAGMGETGRMLIKIGKRGRKHGLGIVGISQRPADVKKDFITQANWLVWHRLTWENDTKVVSRIVGSEYGNRVADLNDGEAFVQADWTDVDVQRVQFNRKQTFDAGATPGLEDVERPELKSVSGSLMEELDSISESADRRADRIEDLERQLEQKDERIAELERELETARDVSNAARKLATALSDGEATDGDGDGEAYERQLRAKNETIRRLEEEVAALESELTAVQDRLAAIKSGTDTASAITRIPEPSENDPTAQVQLGEIEASTTDNGDDPEIDAYMERLRKRGTRLLAEEDPEDTMASSDEVSATASIDSDADTKTTRAEELVHLLHADVVAVRIAAARRDSLCNDDHAWAVIAALLTDGPIGLQRLADLVPASTEQISSFLNELRKRSLVDRDRRRRYRLNREYMADLVARDDDRDRLGELHEQWRIT
ncbi:MAG: helicase HerA domain-containing protein [Halobacteriales archaeon]